MTVTRRRVVRAMLLAAGVVCVALLLAWKSGTKHGIDVSGPDVSPPDVVDVPRERRSVEALDDTVAHEPAGEPEAPAEAAPSDDVIAGRTLAVSLVDGAGKPVDDDATFTWARGSETWIGCAASRLGAGQWRVTLTCDLAGEATELSVAVSGYEPEVVRFGPDDETLRVVLPETGAFVGVVLDQEREFVPGAVIAIGRRTAVSDENGRFGVQGLPIGDYSQVLVRIDGAVQTIRCDVRLRAGGDRHVAELVVTTDAACDVLVLSDGGPVATARVRLEPIDGGPWSKADAKTDEAGRVRLTGMRPGDYTCIVTGKGIATTILDGIRVPAAAPVTIHVSDQPRKTLRGVVKDLAGRPLAGVRVQSPNGKAEPTTTDRDGRFASDVVEPYPMIGRRNPVKWVPPPYLVLSKDGFTTQHRIASEDDGQYVLARRVTITGTVACTVRKPPFTGSLLFVGLHGETVAEQLTTDRKGRFRWVGAPALKGRLQAQLSSELIGTIDVDLTTQESRDVGSIQISPRATLQFSSDAFEKGNTGHVSWRRPGESDFSPWTTISERRNWSTRAVVPSGTLEIVVWAGGRLASGIRSVNVPESGNLVVDTRLHRPSSLRIVLRRDGEARVGQSVELTYEGDFEGEYAWRGVARIWSHGERILFDADGIDERQVTDELGAVWFRRLPPGPYVAQLVDHTGPGGFRQFAVEEGRAEVVVWDESGSE